jgi:basic amino acid/polyamine antiporter, APA family
MGTGEAFVRRSSGLVRNISARDALILNVMFMAPTAVFVYGIWAAGAYPGLNLPVTALLAIPISLVVGLFYALYSVAMPRSGGDYVWVSRTLHPSIGFAINFFLFVGLLSVAAAYVPWLTQFALAPLLYYNGFTDLAATVSTNGFTFVAAIFVYLAMGLIVSRGGKATARSLEVLFALVFIGLIVYVGTLLAIGHDGFVGNFNRFSGMNYSDIASTGIAAGFKGELLGGATLLGLAFTYINFLGFNATIYAAGEIKDVQKSQITAILGSVVVFGLITFIAYAVTDFVMGGAFIQGAGQISAGQAASTLPFPPFMTVLFRYATDNVWAFNIVMIGWTAMVLAAILTYVAITVRFIFAWSFDRVIPAAFSRLDRKHNSPYLALSLVTVVAIVLQWAWLYTNLLTFFLYLVFGWMIMQIIGAISAFVLPRRRPDIWQRAPAIVRARILGVPVFYLLALATVGLSIWIAWGSLPVSLGQELNLTILAFTVGLFVLGWIIHMISWFWHNRAGIPLGLAFKEIPPE